MVSETTQSRRVKNVTHAFPFWVQPICVKMEIFFCTNSPTGIQRAQTFHIFKNTPLNYSVCCGRRTVCAVGGMTIPSRTINIYIWEPVEITSSCIRARTSPYFLDCTELLFDLYKRIYIVNSRVKVPY